MLPGSADQVHTEDFARRHPQQCYQPLGATGLSVSQAGFGCYRVALGQVAHEQALLEALRGGINLIDTSSNYADGESESLVGEVLDRWIDLDGRREEIVVVSKVGYLQGRNYALARQREAQGRPFPELVPYDEGLEHCIHPQFLADQLDRSLARLRLTKIDVYLLHNPEYYLNWAAHERHPRIDAEHEFYRRIEAAFRHLEQEVQAGRISFYGISSNTFPVQREDQGFCALDRVLEIAREIAPDHHFRVVQFPMNLIERGAAIQNNQTQGRTVLDLCRDEHMGVLINRPLNAIYQGRMLRLAEAEAVLPTNHPLFAKVQQNVRIVRQQLSAADRAWHDEQASLSQLAVRALRSTRGVSCTLVGMRQPSYVADVLSELARPITLKNRTESWQRLEL